MNTEGTPPKRTRAARVLTAAGLIPLVIASVAVMTFLSPSHAPASAATVGPVVPPSTGVLFGASIAATPGRSSAVAFGAEEATLGRGLAIDRSYAHWDDPQPSGPVLDDKAHGRIPMLSIIAQRANGTKVSWASIAAGSQDSVIRAQALGLKSTGIPMILIFHHEPEVSTGYGTAADFVAAFRHYVAVVRGQGATNISFGLVLTPYTFNNPSAWYPGDDVVDWIGTDAYNTANCNGNGNAWRSLATAGAAFYKWAAPHGKPLMLAEWGSAEDPSDPGHKAQWFTDAEATLASWPAVKAVAYFDQTGATCDWHINSSASSLSAFRALAHSPVANGAPTARLLTSVGTGAAPLHETFGLQTSTGAHNVTGSGVTSWSLDFGDGTAVARGSGQPGQVPHVYAAGTWTSTLVVTDSSGRHASTTRQITASAPPVVSEGNATALTTSSATTPAWIDNDSLPTTYYYQVSRTTTFAAHVAAAGMPASPYTLAVSAHFTGLVPGTRYYWRVCATTAAGTTVGPTRWFTTSG